MTWAIAELLSEHAGRATVSNPMRTRAIASAKVKTDKIDARVLAQLGAADFLPEVWAPDEVTRALRRRIAHRSSLVRQRTRLRNQIHADHGDVTRFPSPRQLVGYLGLDPRVRQSGEKAARHGRISRAGQAHARGLLIEAAHTAIRTAGPLRAFHARIAARRGSRSRSARPPASWPCSPGTCCPRTRTTATRRRRSPSASCATSSVRPRTPARRSASPARPSARSSSADSSKRPSATTATTSRPRHDGARVPPPGTRLLTPSMRPTMRGGLHTPQMPALLVRGHPRQEEFLHPARDASSLSRRGPRA